MRSGRQRNQDSRNTCEMLDIPLTLQSAVLLEKLTVAQPDDKLHNWYLVFCIAKKGHYSVRNRQQLGPLWATRIMPTPSPPLAFSIHFNIIVPFTPKTSKKSLSVRFPYQNLYVVLFFPMLATCSVYFIFLELITLMVFVRKTCCVALRYAVLRPKISFSVPPSRWPLAFSFLNVKDQARQNYIFVSTFQMWCQFSLPASSTKPVLSPTPGVTFRNISQCASTVHVCVLTCVRVWARLLTKECIEVCLMWSLIHGLIDSCD